MKTPVLFLIFNRPEQTFRVFEEIRKAKPEKLFIAADGPRSDKAGEAEKCTEVRKVAELVDWECEVKTLFREKNLGCKIAVSEGINWFFENVEEGIILEDDCLPDPSFFIFCEALLERYRDHKEIMHISGTNFQKGNKRGKHSYYFSKMPLIWGWASWKRAWNNYSVSMEGLEDFKNNGGLKETFKKKHLEDFYYNKLIQTKQGKINTWDYQWSFAVWKQHGICITPNVNLISNIGFGTDATHTESVQDEYAEIKTECISNLLHPSGIHVNYVADNFFYKFQTGIKGEFWYYMMLINRNFMRYGAKIKQKIKLNFY